jgi:hypothetical protein
MGGEVGGGTEEDEQDRNGGLSPDRLLVKSGPGELRGATFYVLLTALEIRTNARMPSQYLPCQWITRIKQVYRSLNVLREQKKIDRVRIWE